MQNKLSIKILAPIFSILLLVVVISITLVSNQVEDNVKNNINSEIRSYESMIIENLALADELVSQQVRGGMKILKDLTMTQGNPVYGNVISVKGKSSNDLVFGAENIANNFRIVDKVKSYVGGTATIFANNNGEYVRISTNVEKSDGSRAIGTILNPNGKAIKNINNKEAYYGIVHILGNPYLTGYEPIVTDEGVLGIWYTGYKLSSLSEVGKLIAGIKLLDDGFIALVDNKGKYVFHSDNKNIDEIKSVLESDLSDKENGWTVNSKVFEEWDYKIVTAYPIKNLDDIVSASTNTVMVTGSLVGIVLLFAVWMLVQFFIVKPIKSLKNITQKISEGDLSVRSNLKGNDELAELSDSVNNMVEQIEDSLSEVKEKSLLAEDAAQEARKEQEKAIEYSRFLDDHTNRLIVEMEKLAKGDLTAKAYTDQTNGIMSKLFTGFNQAVDKIRDLLNTVVEVVNSTVSATNEISSSTEEMAAGAQQQSSQTTEIAGAVNQMTKTIFDTSQNTSRASDNAKKAREAAQKGGDIVSQTIEGMNKIAKVVNEASGTIKELGANSNEIGEIIQVINDIADQTNLLALNAAIEAARAGEQGRGFAVVADEVRKLAERTTKATKEIADMIVQIQQATNDAVTSIENGNSEVESGKNLSVQAGESLKEIIRESESVSDVIHYLASASEEQSAAAEEISKNIESINQVTHEQAAGIQEVARESEDLSMLSAKLSELISTFNLGHQVKNSAKVYDTHVEEKNNY